MLKARAKPPGKKREALNARAKPPGKKGKRGRWQPAGHGPPGNMPASYRYRGQSIIAKLKNKIKLKLHESAWNAKNLKNQPRVPKRVLRKIKLLLSFPCLKNRQFGKILLIILTITNLFSKTKKDVTQLKSLRGIPLLNKRIINRLKRSGFVRIW
ncbi:hypothetical protein GGTG_09006 [Gaeumannomyces tritici R3-111a-1]|uniref:Uncharacterized protein n=1 Tax=Gaeumannomyces tritici (strain R3-111a-1) TaxID=644352 RepID=J3P666_GAET3|nr:hypothetical protein GGTG_09006 [Gaeumannomyces tritici R3-111a-1]EJT72139.1 hypothetical protein GGTG_09006 [Gaeumannomyces tritici R3-111a-1]